jgi:hypothetical protein
MSLITPSFWTMAYFKYVDRDGNHKEDIEYFPYDHDSWSMTHIMDWFEDCMDGHVLNVALYKIKAS